MRLFIRFLLVMFCCIPLASAERSDISAMNQNTAPESKTTPRRLLRGAFYFHYLNDDYQKALSALHQWRSFDGRVNAESHVMEAAILLILGLDGQAQAAYERVEASGGRASGDAWFHLARRWMDVGAWQKAESSINSALQQRLTLNDEYYQQALFIQATSRSHQDLVAEAKVALDSMTPGSVWAGLARYNWMLALIRSNANSRDLENFVEQTLFSLPDTYEGKAIHDRMLLVAGIYALDSGKNRAAEAYFKEISLESAFTAPGLLHYGWSLVEQWKYQEAMQPWRILQQKYNDFHPAVVESILGVPHALELLNATTQSLKTYEVVEIKLQRMLTKLTELNQDAKIDAWLNQWLDQHEGQPWGWMRTELEDMPDSDMTRALQLMLDDRQFNQLTEQLYDLKRLADELAQQQRDLELWQQILKQRQQQLRSAGGAQRLMALEKRHRALVDEVLDMQQQLHAEDAKIFAFASTQDTKNIEHLSSVVPEWNTYIKSTHQPGIFLNTNNAGAVCAVYSYGKYMRKSPVGAGKVIALSGNCVNTVNSCWSS